ncbi:hypothetical protein OZ410_11285 [Robiginitalea sp. M366]|uniref:hypothetical protein n=1 Tax=Robiginitalea aestuariiviva TaxID=3036903 RepID=UPI00240D663B|nr:hypothetical protein [Robiginitalea aestuariiviva]MDG1572900.1 hypothetical protein [Robiginitalea aestuariiviva]
MKSIWVGALCLLLTSGLQAQETLTPEQWQQDLDHLQATLHQEYPFLFKKITPSDFDTRVAALRQAIPDMEAHEVMVGLARLVAGFGYGHTILGYWEGKVPYHQLPLVLYQFDDGIYLEGVHRDYASLAGARLTAIEGMPVAEVLERMRPVVPAENEMFVKAYGIHYLTFPEFLHAQGVLPRLQQEITLTLEKDGNTLQASVKAVPAFRIPTRYGRVKPGADWVSARDTANTPLYLKHLDRIYYYQYLPGENTVYVRHSQIQDDSLQTIPAFYREVFDFVEQHQVEKLILDVRLNGGGNNYKNKPIVTGLIRSRVNKPGKLMVIIGRRTFSACQNLVNEIHNYTHAVFVGEPTAENINFYGDNRPLTLPNSGLHAYVSYAWWQDKPQWENADWLAPQLPAGLTFKQYQNNQDPALEAALAFRDSTFIGDPMAHLTKLFNAGEIEQVKSEAARMIADPNYAYFDFEAEFDMISNRLLKDNLLQESYFVSEMLVSFFPESASAWLTRARIFNALGNREQAVISAEKALTLGLDATQKEEAEALIQGG